MSDTLPQRPAFSNGQYIGAADLNAAVGYARDETERLALSGRSWGIATGLALVERTTPSGDVQMFIEPGIAWDGYGRPVAVLAPAPVTPDLFANLPSGNQIVWLRYRAVGTQMIAPGFQTCGSGDPATRIAETYAIETGNKPVTSRTGGVIIAGTTVDDPRGMLIAVDQSAAVVLDGSAPHQLFPDDSARWLIPVGIAAYTAGSPGTFSARTAAQLTQNRLVRRYMGAVAESVLAADGILRLRDRQTAQQSGVTNDALDAAAAIQASDIAADPNNASRLIGNELVWVEGNMRVTGNARLFGTRLELWDKSGAEAGGAPEFLRRGVSPHNTQAGQDLQICIGAAKGTAGADRLAIGVVEDPTAANPEGLLDERMVVRTDGKVAIGTNAIDSYAAEANTLVVAAAADTGITVVSSPANTGNLYFANGPAAAAKKAGFVAYDHGKQQLSLGAGANQVLTLTAAGQEVIGPADPAKFASDASQLIVSSASGPVGMTIAGQQGTAGRIDFANGTATPDAGFIRYDLSADRMAFGTASHPRVYVDNQGRLGIGTASPAAAIEVASPSDSHALRMNLSSIQATNAGFASPLALQPNGDRVGIGLTGPGATLHVRASGAAAGLTIDGTNNTTALTAGNGAVGIGFAGTARTKLDVRGTVGAGSTLAAHVAIVENNSSGASNVLALKLDAGSIGSCNFITFFDGAGNQVGAVEGTTSIFGLNSITYQAYTAADYAEALPRAEGVAPIGPGRVVGVHAGHVSLETAGAQAVFVTTDRPAVLGNAPPRSERERFELLAFIGQVPVTVAGPIQAGDLIAASGQGDGMGRAVPLASVQPEDLPLIVGSAWESAQDPAPKRVNALVGPGVASAAAASALLARQAREIERLSQQLIRRDPEPEPG
jgi:hypothetical protein